MVLTVYRRFGGEGALVDALAIRECRRCLTRIAAALEPASRVDERLASLFTATLRVIREHPVLARLARVEPEALLAEVTRDDSGAVRLGREFLTGLIREGQRAGELVGGDPTVLAELGLRLGLSFVLMPDTAPPLSNEAKTRETMRAILAPE
jgi:TetR/AcrR family transcriptional regulator, repressor for uid operon